MDLDIELVFKLQLMLVFKLMELVLQVILKVGTAVVGIATTLGNRGHIVSVTITNTGTGYTDFVHDRLTTMSAVAVAGTTIVSVATTEE